jgi:hypothetical protein
MSHDEQVADFARRNKEARDQRTLTKARATRVKMDADRAAGIEQAPAGSIFKEKALANTGELGQAGQGVREGSQTVLEKTDTTGAKVGGMVAKVVTGADVRNIIQGGAVLGDLAGQSMVANDSSIQKGYKNSQTRNAESSVDLQSKVSDFQSATKGSAERKAGALSAFRSAGTRARDQAELGAYQDLKMKVGPEEYSKDEVLGKAAPENMDYEEGDVVKRDDALHGSTYGKLKRAVVTGGMSTSGKLSDEQKAEVASIQGELDTEKNARTAEHEAREAGSVKGRMKRAVTLQGSKLTDDEKTNIDGIKANKVAHEATAAQTEAQLKGEKDQIKTQVATLKSQQPSGPLITDARKAKHAEVQRQIEALQPSLDDARKKLADHRSTAEAASAEFDGQVSDIHARADGGFTRAETAARAAKEEQIKGIQTGATAAAAFTDKHEGETINHYNRVGGMIDRMEDPAKMEATRLGTAADYANKGFEHVEDAGKMVGGSADDARDLQEQGKYLKSGITAGVAVGVGTAQLAGAALPGVAHLGDGTQKVISGGLRGVGMIGQALTEDAAKAERERTHSRDVVEGRRREALKSKSFVTTRQPNKDTPSILGGVGELAKAALGADAVKESIEGVLGLGEPEAGNEETGTSAENEVNSESGGVPDAHDAPAVPDAVPDVHGAPAVPDVVPDVHDAPDMHDAPAVPDAHDAPAVPDAVPDVHGAPAVPDVVPDVHGAPDMHDAPAVPDVVPDVHGAPDMHDAPAVPDVVPDVHGAPDMHDAPAVPDVVPDVHGAPDMHDAPAVPDVVPDVHDAPSGGVPDESVPEAEKPESFQDNVVDNIKGEAYEAGADGLVDKGTEKAGAMLAGPTIIAKADAPVHTPAVTSQVGPVPNPGPTPGPTPSPGAGKVPWWKRLWNAVKRGASSVASGVKRGARSVVNGFKSAGRWIGRRFGRK